MAKNNALFVDIDGVLNSRRTRYYCNGCLGIDTYNLGNLKIIAEICDAKIILISGWKDDWDKEKKNPEKHNRYGKYIDRRMKSVGLEVADKTEGSGLYAYSKRPDGIREYIKKNNVGFFLILDDECYDGYMADDLKEYWIQTDGVAGGLGSDHVIRAIKLYTKHKNANAKSRD